MLSMRIVAAGALLALAASGAAAQTATTNTPGKPLPLLQILEKPAKARSRHQPESTRRTGQKTGKRISAKHDRVAAKRKRRPAPVRTVQHTAPPNVWPAANAASMAAPGPVGRTPASIWPDPNVSSFAASDADGTAPANSWPQTNAPLVGDAGGVEPGITSAPDDAALREIVVDGQTVQVASPDKLNAIDRAADRPNAAEDTVLQSDFSQAAPATQATAAALPGHDTSKVGSEYWFAKILAALGGAIATGSAAWFLIGSVAPRIYG